MDSTPKDRFRLLLFRLFLRLEALDRIHRAAHRHGVPCLTPQVHCVAPDEDEDGPTLGGMRVSHPRLSHGHGVTVMGPWESMGPVGCDEM